MAVDPTASLRIWVIEFDLAGQTFQVPPVPAADWLPVLAGGDMLAVLDLVEDSVKIDDLVMAGEVTVEQLSEVLDQVVERATGRTTWAALVLAGMAQRWWDRIGGELARSGFRWDQQPIGAALDAVRSVVLSLAKNQESTDRLVSILNSERPLTGSGGRRRPVDRSRALQDFETMAGPRPDRVPAPTSAEPSAGAPPRTPLPPRQPPQVAA